MHVRHVGVIAVLVLGAAACGSSSSKGSSATNSTSSGGNPTTSAAPATTAAPTGATPVKVAKVGDDTLVVDSKGMTVYAFNPDTATKAACNTGCDKVWPPVTVTGTPPSTISGLPVTVLSRSDGAKQIVLNGHPLYTFSGDAKPGDTNGQGVGNMWYYVNEKGEPDKG